MYLVVIVWETVVVGRNRGHELGTCECEHVFKGFQVTRSGVREGGREGVRVYRYIYILSEKYKEANSKCDRQVAPPNPFCSRAILSP